jgi:hypothetical protein
LLAALFFDSKAEADIQFTFPVQSSEEEELRLIFNWKSAQMSDLAIFDNDDSLYPSPDIADKIDYYHGNYWIISFYPTHMALNGICGLLYLSLRWLCAYWLQAPLRRALDVRAAASPGENEADFSLQQHCQASGLLSHHPRTCLSGIDAMKYTVCFSHEVISL